MLTNLSEAFIEDIHILNQKKVPQSVFFQAKKCLLDYLGATIAGSRFMHEKGGILIELLGECKHGASVIGFNKKANIQTASFINGLSSHILELDDGIRFGALHPGAPIISALLAVAEKERIDGRSFLKGMIIGYESAIRIAYSVQPSHYSKGYHPTGTCGTIGAAMAVSIALGFTKIQMKNSFSASVTSAFGSLKVLEDISELKPYNVARASNAGLLSSYLARAGFSSPDDSLSGKTGFLEMMSDRYDQSCLKTREDNSYWIEHVYFKPYASCRHCHAAIDATLTLRRKNNIDFNEIKEIRVSTYNSIIGRHDHKIIEGVSSAKMSSPYSVAVALVFGRASIDEFSPEYVSDTRVLSLAREVSVHGDEELTSLVPQMRPATVEVIKHNGAIYEERVDYPKGEPENPLSEEEIKDKFMTLAMYGNKTKEEAEEIIECVWDLENRLGDLFDLL